MINRRLVTAAVLSLGFHAVLLTAVGFITVSGSEAPSNPPIQSATLVRLTAGREINQVVAEPVQDEIPVQEPVLPPVKQAAEILTDSNTANGIADSLADSTGSPGEVALSQKPEDSEPSLITNIEPVYPIQARRLGVEGVVDLLVTVDSRGIPVECTVIPPRVHKVLEKSALAAVMQARFKPGTESGRPIQDTYRLKVRFELET